MTARFALRSVPSPLFAVDPVDASPGRLCRLEGEYWTIIYEGTVIRLRDAKGVRYLGYLLHHPGERVPCAALVSEVSEPGSAAASSREHARLAVTKRIKATLAKIETLHPTLAQHLTTQIRTGHCCVYACDPNRLVSWRA